MQVELLTPDEVLFNDEGNLSKFTWYQWSFSIA